MAALPAVSITTDASAPIVDKETYIGAGLTIAATDDFPAFTGRASVKGRGNSTWVIHPKKPYRIKLNSTAGLLGMPSDKNWVLLANYSDKTLLRNRTSFEFSRRLGRAWTPRAVPVEVTLNGVYLGVYDLVEQVRVAGDRVDITETKDSTAPEAGGYLVEINERMDDPVCWRTLKGVAVCIKAPDPGTDVQNTYIKDYIQDAENSLFTADSMAYQAYFDVDALIDWYLVNELFKNPDSKDWGSIYIQKDAGGKLTYGPVWDFDLAAGNRDYFDATPQGFWTATAPWLEQMAHVDPAIKTRVRARWNAMKPQIDTLPAYIDAQAWALSEAQARNFTKWPILNQYVWPNSEVAGSYQGEVDFFRNWMVSRIAWMDANL